MRAAAAIWRNYSITVKDAWRDRAENLNQLPVDGLFDNLPIYIMEYNKGFEKNVIVAMYEDWRGTSTTIEQSIRRGPKPGVQQNKTYRYGKWNVQLGTHIQRQRVSIASLVKTQMFGSNHENLRQDIVVCCARNRTVFHVHTTEQ